MMGEAQEKRSYLQVMKVLFVCSQVTVSFAVCPG